MIASDEHHELQLRIGDISFQTILIKLFHSIELYRLLLTFRLFIHSGHFYRAPSSPLLLRDAPDYSTNTVSEFHVEAHGYNTGWAR